MINETLFKHLERGDHVKLLNGDVGTVQHFGFFNGNKWLHSSRKRANGLWLWFPDNRSDGYVHRSSIADYIPSPLLIQGTRLQVTIK